MNSRLSCEGRTIDQSTILVCGSKSKNLLPLLHIALYDDEEENTDQLDSRATVYDSGALHCGYRYRRCLLPERADYLERCRRDRELLGV